MGHALEACPVQLECCRCTRCHEPAGCGGGVAFKQGSRGAEGREREREKEETVVTHSCQGCI